VLRLKGASGEWLGSGWSAGGRCAYWVLRLLVDLLFLALLFLRSCYRCLVTGTAGTGSPGSRGVVPAVVGRCAASSF